MALGGSDRAAFVEDAQQEILAARGCQDRADRTAHQAGRARHRSQEHPFLPHVLDDVFARNRAGNAARENLRDGADPVRHLAVAFAEGERLLRLQLNHLALVIERHHDRAEAAEHAIAAEFCVEDIQMPHAVEHRDDRGLLAPTAGAKDLIASSRSNALQLRNTTSNFSVELVGLHRRRIFQGDVAVGAFDHKARRGQFGRAPRANQKRDIAAGLRAACRRNIRRWRRRRPREYALFGSGYCEGRMVMSSEWRIANSE